MKGIIALDIDGTLTHRKDWIDPKVVETLKFLSKQWHIVLVTGRVFAFTEKILKYLNFPYLLAVQNGADILEMPSKKLLQRNYLSSTLVPHIETAYQGTAEDFIVYAGLDAGDFCYFRPQKFSQDSLKYLKILESFGTCPWKESDFQFHAHATFSLIKCFGEKTAMERVHNRLHINPEMEISMIHDPINPAFHLNLITHPEANKGAVIDFLKIYFGNPHVIAAGNDRNDLKMLQKAQIGIAIDTAPEEVLACATFLAKPPEELGIIDALYQAIEL